MKERLVRKEIKEPAPKASPDLVELLLTNSGIVTDLISPFVIYGAAVRKKPEDSENLVDEEKKVD